LQLAKETLTDTKLRKSYDTWLNSGIQIPFEQWQNKKAHSMHWAPPRQMKLSIQEKMATGQMDPEQSSSNNGEIHSAPSGSLLEKFRKYEI